MQPDTTQMQSATRETGHPGNSPTATIYRMVTDNHICPFGIKSKDLLLRKGFKVEDHPLTTREQTDQFKESYHVETTPQTFINGERVGGYEELRERFGL